jgi:sec-independent protein translocase protein TatB
MFSFAHLTILFLIALMVFGPEKLPELARKLGKAMAEFRRITGDVKRVVEDEMNEIDRQKREADLKAREAAVAEKEKAVLPPGDASAVLDSTPPPSDEVTAPAGTVPAQAPSATRAETLAVTVVPAPDSTEGKPDA